MRMSGDGSNFARSKINVVRFEGFFSLLPVPSGAGPDRTDLHCDVPSSPGCLCPTTGKLASPSVA